MSYSDGTTTPAVAYTSDNDGQRATMTDGTTSYTKGTTYTYTYNGDGDGPPKPSTPSPRRSPGIEGFADLAPAIAEETPAEGFVAADAFLGPQAVLGLLFFVVYETWNSQPRNHKATSCTWKAAMP